MKDVEDYINYGVKDGYLDEDTALAMTEKEKVDYYNRAWDESQND